METTIPAKQQPNAFRWLSAGLQEYASQSIKGDAVTIAGTLNISDRLVRSYLKGVVLDLETGKKILVELKLLIKAREESVKKLIS